MPKTVKEPTEAERQRREDLNKIGRTAGLQASLRQFDGLMLRVPAGANVFVLVDVDGVYSSPMATNKDWKATFGAKWSDLPILLPPEARRFVLASHVDLLNNLRSNWETAIVELGTPIPMTTVARAEGGYLDSIDSIPVVWTPSHAYFVQFDSQVLGVVYPDDRQALARWLALSKTGQNAPLSGYVREATKRLRSAGQVVLAVDLSNVAPPHRIDRAIKESGVLNGKDASPIAVAEAFSSLRGVTVAIDFQSHALAEARIEFGANIRAIKPFAKELVLATMCRLGIQIDDSKDWKVTTDADTITVRGMLTEKGLRLLSSFIELPTSKFSTLARESESNLDPMRATVGASIRYFRTLEREIDDLRGGLNTDAKSAWYEKTARKIDNMPILHVDDELLAFGATVANNLRQTAEQGPTIGRLNSENQIAAIASYGNYYDGSGGYYSTAGHIPTIQRHAINASSQNRTRGMQLINGGLGDIRRKMTKKYQVEF